MSHLFNAHVGLLLVEAEISGPTRSVVATLVLDTGATTTSLYATVLRFVGYDPDAATDFVSMMTRTRVERVPRMMVNRLSALGRHAIGLRVLAHDLPAVAAVDGLLGLDYFRNLLLTIDFRAGQITLA
jgi:hypothetical protein